VASAAFRKTLGLESMKLDPVYLLAPDPAPARPPESSRRRFATGVAVGLLSGLAAGSGLARLLAPRPAGADETDEPTGDDARLRWALDLQQGPLEDLVAGNTDFLLAFTEHPDVRDRLEPGIYRLVIAVLEDDDAVADRRALLAAKLAQSIDSLPPDARLRTHLPFLRRLAR
jgi:hypothetical protein